MSVQPPDPPRSLTALIDALVGYAIEPDQWQHFLRELETAGGALATMDPQVLLSHLSRAETVAWQLRGQTGSNPHADHIVVGKTGAVTRKGIGAERLSGFVTATKGQALKFVSAQSAQEWRNAVEQLDGDPNRTQVLLTLRSKDERRFGFVAHANDLPDTLTGSEPDGYVLLIPNANGNEGLSALVRSSFSLTAAETELALRLAAGAPLKTCASQLGISVNTARNQLQSVFDKSGIKRQSDLILVIIQLGVMLSGVRKTAVTPTIESERPDHDFALLTDGRRLAYRSYGEPGGMPLLYLHETAGSSLLLPNTQALCRELGIRLIATERPGVGFSDPHPAYTFASIACDHEALLDHLGLERCAVVGHMSGAAHAIALASAAPDRIAAVLCVNTRVPAPAASSSASEGLNLITTRLLGQPWLLRTFFNILRHRASPETNRKILRSVMRSPADQAVMADQPELLEHMVAYSLESLTVSATGMVDEVRCFAALDAAGEIDLDRIRASILVWHANDCSITDADSAERWLGKHAEKLERIDGGSSLLLYWRWREALATLRDRFVDANAG